MDLIAKIVVFIGGVFLFLSFLTWVSEEARNSHQARADACNARGGWYDSGERICQVLPPGVTVKQ